MRKWIFFFPQVRFNTLKKIHKAITFPSGKKWTCISTFLEGEITRQTPLYSQVRNNLLIKTQIHMMFVGAHFQLIKRTQSWGCALGVLCSFLATLPQQGQPGNQTVTRGAGCASCCVLSLHIGTEHWDVATVEFPVPLGLALSRFAAHPSSSEFWTETSVISKASGCSHWSEQWV